METKTESFNFQDFVHHLSAFRRYCIVYLCILIVCFIAWLRGADSLLQLAYAPFREVGIETFFFSHVYTPFLLRLNVALLASFFSSLPVGVFLLCWFLRKSLPPRVWLLYVCLGFFLLTFFMAGVVGAYLILLPLCLQFFLSYAEGLAPLFNIDVCVKFVITIVLMGGCTTLLPVFIIGFVVSGIFSLEFMYHLRRYVWISAFIIAAFLTPPDVVSQCLAGGLLVIAYELGVLVLYIRKKIRRKKNKPK